MNNLAASIWEPMIVIVTAPLTIGLIRTCKARLQQRHGASILQPYWNLLSLWRKEMTITKHSSWVFHAVPGVVFATSLLLAVLMPVITTNGILTSFSNVFFVAAILMVGSLFLVLGGMDVASAFGGMGASREMTLAALIEPALLIVFTTLGILANTWHFQGIVAAAHFSWITDHPFFIATVLSLGCIVLAENARYPVDNPATHLELTMVHEAMILEYSGPYLALLEYAAAIRLTVLGTLFTTFVLPITLITPHPSFFISIGWYLVHLLVLGILIALIETVFVKMRFYRMNEYMMASYILGLAGLILSIVF